VSELIKVRSPTAACDVVVDFTVATRRRNTLPWLAMHGIHAVVGTTGFTDDDLARFESRSPPTMVARTA
jgi:dihydrodipicolinate reductase